MPTVSDVLAAVDRLAPFRAAALLWLCLAGTGLAMAAATPAEPAAAPKPDAAPVIAVLEAMASSDNPAVKFYAKRLAEALAKNDVAVPKSLLALSPPVAAQKALSDKDRQLVRDFDNSWLLYLISVRKYGAYIGLKPNVLPTHWLQRDLSLAQAEACPDVPRQIEDASSVVGYAVDAEHSGELDLAIVARALQSAVAQLIEACAGKAPDTAVSDSNMPRLPRETVSTFVTALALTDPNTTETTLTKTLDELDAKIAAARKSAKGENSTRVLDHLASQVQETRKDLPQIVMTAAAHREITRLAAALIAALNRKDREALLACLTKQGVELFNAGPRKDSILVLPAGAKEVQFVSVRTRGRMSSNQARVIVFLRFTDESGQVRLVPRLCWFAKTDKGWLLDVP
jgi:CheY-like chemotaxis protein